jgi:hypothetical protein
MQIDCNDIKSGLIIDLDDNTSNGKYNITNCRKIFWHDLEDSGAETSGEIADTSYYLGIELGVKAAVEMILQDPNILK